MALHTSHQTQSRARFVNVFLKTALLAGTLDILFAFVHAYVASGTSPAIVLKYIASGLLGSAAFSGGVGIILSGLAIHYLIAAAWSMTFLWLYPRVGLSSRNIFLSAFVIGVFIWLAMRFLILPLTKVPQSPFNPVQAAIGAIILIFAIGLPISYFARKYYVGNAGPKAK